MLNKYFEIRSCYERENKETKEKEVVVIANELRWKGAISSYTQFFVFEPEKFVEMFRGDIRKDERNFWLERKVLNCDLEYLYHPKCIVSKDNIPENLK